MYFSCLSATQTKKVQIGIKLLFGFGYSFFCLLALLSACLFTCVFSASVGQYELAERIYSNGNFILPNPTGCTATGAFPPQEHQAIIDAFAAIDKVYGPASLEHKHFVEILRQRNITKDSCG